MTHKIKWPLLFVVICTLLVAVYAQVWNTPQTFSQSQTIEERVQSGNFIEHQGFLYINNGDLVIYDLENPDQPAEVFRLPQVKEDLQLFDNWLLLESSITDALLVYNVSTPASPVKEGEFIHEESIVDGISFYKNNIWWKGTLVDLSDSSEPTLIPVFTPPTGFGGTFTQESDNLASSLVDNIACGRPGCFGSYVHQIIDISDLSNPIVVISKTVDASDLGYFQAVNQSNGIFAYTASYNAETGREEYDVLAYEYTPEKSLELRNQYSNIVNAFSAHPVDEYFYVRSYRDETQSGWYRYKSPFALPILESDGMGVASFDHSLDNGHVLVSNRVGYFGYPPPESELSTTYTFRNQPPSMCSTGQNDFDGALNATLLENDLIFNVFDLGIGHKVLSISQLNSSNNLAKQGTLPLFTGVTEQVGVNGVMGNMEILVKGNENLYLRYRDLLLVTIDISNTNDPQLTSYFVTRELDAEEQAFFDPILASFNPTTPRHKSILSYLFAPIMRSGPTLLFENAFGSEGSNSGDLNIYFDCDSESNACFEQIEAGINGTGAFFDGEQHYLEIKEIQDWWVRDLPSPLQEFSEPFTVSAWVKPSSTDGLRNIVSRGHSLTPDHEIIFRIQDGNYEFGFWDGESTDAVASFPVPESNLTEWGHLVGVYTGDSWNLYFNGELVGSTADNADAMTCSSAAWAIGRSGNVEERYFHGYMDEVQFYQGAMSARQVRQHYEQR